MHTIRSAGSRVRSSSRMDGQVAGVLRLGDALHDVVDADENADEIGPRRVELRQLVVDQVERGVAVHRWIGDQLEPFDALNELVRPPLGFGDRRTDRVGVSQRDVAQRRISAARCRATGVGTRQDEKPDDAGARAHHGRYPTRPCSVPHRMAPRWRAPHVPDRHAPERRHRPAGHDESGCCSAVGCPSACTRA